LGLYEALALPSAFIQGHTSAVTSIVRHAMLHFTEKALEKSTVQKG
jgi:hypothetical protein